VFGRARFLEKSAKDRPAIHVGDDVSRRITTSLSGGEVVRELKGGGLRSARAVALPAIPNSLDGNFKMHQDHQGRKRRRDIFVVSTI